MTFNFKYAIIPILFAVNFGCSAPAKKESLNNMKKISESAENNNNSAKNNKESKEPVNPLLKPFSTPFGVPPFDKIKDSDYLPAIKYAMEVHKKEIALIADNSNPATFKNTIEALDYAGELLTKVTLVFYAQHSADTNDEIQKIAKEVSPVLSNHFDKISMNSKLFARVKAVFDSRDSLDLTGEQARLLELTYKGFTRGGALLNNNDKEKLTAINSRLSVLSVQFGENLLAENNEFKLIITDKSKLAGLPESSIEAAKKAADDDGISGWKFTLHKPSWIPFMQFADNRELRQIMFEGYTKRGNHGNKNDNKAILLEMVRLRIQRAALLGYKNHGEYALEESMAQNPENVMELLNKIWSAALPASKKEAHRLQKIMNKDLKTKREKPARLMPCDWFYYTEKLRKERYNLSDEELRPYFKLENVQKGAFGVASKLYGLKFKELDNIPVYNKDVKAFEVIDKDNTHLGILYVDYFPRPGKQQGAWMTEYRGQEIKDGNFVHPVIVNVFNFTKPSKEKPALLSLEEVETLFHEFGHALHGLLSSVTYPALSGTNVPRDFVEMPSQFMENWAVEPEVLKTYAFNYKTHEIIPDKLIKKMEDAAQFNQGFATVEYMAASFLDMEWHTLKSDPGSIDVNKFETDAMNRTGLIDEIVPRYRSPYFAHIFNGGYSAGYYSYIWSAVLDSDAFAAFKETPDLFNKEVADSFRKNILSKGNTQKPIDLYIKFRGREPDIKPLLKKRGLLNIKK